MYTVILPLLIKEPFVNFPVVGRGMVEMGSGRDLGWRVKTGKILTRLIQTRKDKNNLRRTLPSLFSLDISQDTSHLWPWLDHLLQYTFRSLQIKQIPGYSFLDERLASHTDQILAVYRWRLSEGSYNMAFASRGPVGSFPALSLFLRNDLAGGGYAGDCPRVEVRGQLCGTGLFFHLCVGSRIKLTPRLVGRGL